MSDEVLKRLDVLGAKLGVAGEHLWEVLCRQGVLEGWFGVVLILVCFLCLVGAFFSVWKFREWDNKNEFRAVLAMFTGIVLCLISLVTFICGLDRLPYLLNPEMYALNYFKGLF